MSNNRFLFALIYSSAFKISSVHKETCQCNDIKRPEDVSSVNTRNVVYTEYTL